MITIQKEIFDGTPFEECVFCDKPTKWWSTRKDVPVCRICATKHEEWSVPDKAEWAGKKTRNQVQRENNTVIAAVT